jgi:hypothetical protein
MAENDPLGIGEDYRYAPQIQSTITKSGGHLGFICKNKTMFRDYFWMDEFNIDPNVFDDIYMEAATRAVDKRQNEPNFKVAVIIKCWIASDVDKPDKHICYNTYFVMINSGLHIKAENFRRNFLLLHNSKIFSNYLLPLMFDLNYYLLNLN